MRSKNISGATVTDLGTITVLNTGTSADTIQFGDSATGPFNTAAVVAAGQATDVKIAGRYAAIENGAGTLVLLGN
jgi:hypothetical protein